MICVGLALFDVAVFFSLPHVLLLREQLSKLLPELVDLVICPLTEVKNLFLQLLILSI